MSRTEPAESVPTLDLAVTPLSYPGSWLSVSRVVGLGITADDPHLVSHRAGPRPVLSLSAEIGRVRVEAELSATAVGLTWSHGCGSIELTFDGEAGLRVRGSGLGLRVSAVAPELTPFAGTYAFADPGGWVVFTSYETGFRYLVTVLRGRAHMSGDQALGAAERSVLVVGEGPDPDWEIQLREARSGGAGTPDRPEPFDDLQARNQLSYRAFRQAFPALPDQRTGDLAAYVLWSSLVGAGGFVRRPAMLMSKNWMDKVWAWDPCFNALALAPAHPDLAWDQYLVMFDHQDSATGVIPDSVTHSEVLFNFVKPPVHGWALRELRRRLARPLTREQLTAAYRNLSGWTRFWLEHRRAPGHLLPYYEHGNDSGWDNSTTFDSARLIESPDLAAFLIVQLDVLADLAGELGTDPDERVHWASEGDSLYNALLGQLWDGERFIARAVHTGLPSNGTSLLNLLPLVLADRLPTEITEALTLRLRAHMTPWGVATEPPTSSEYESDGYWRGPIWAPSSVLIDFGLRLAGCTEIADTARARFLSLCARSGFAENFDAVTGAGLRDRAYTWTASSYLLFASDQARSAVPEASTAMSRR